MPAFRRNGWSDALTDSRLNWLLGTAYPVAPTNLYISLLSGEPLSDGSGTTNEVVRVGPVVYGAPQTPAGLMGFPGDRRIMPSGPVSFTPPGSASPLVYASGSSWALFTQASGGNPVFSQSYTK